MSANALKDLFAHLPPQGRLLMAALRARAKSEIAEGYATLGVYANQSVGVGEHPQILEEARAQIDKVASAQDALNVLDSLPDEKRGS